MRVLFIHFNYIIQPQMCHHHIDIELVLFHFNFDIIKYVY